MHSDNERIEQNPPGGSYDVEQEVVERTAEDEALEKIDERD